MINRSIIRWGIIGTIILLIVLLCQFIGWRYVFFNLVGENPSSSTLPTSQSTIIFTFNRDLQKDTSIKVTGTDKTYRINLSKNVISIVFAKSLDEGENITVDIKAISKNGTIKLVRQYHTEYVSFNQLSPEEQQRQTNESDSFEGDYPLVDQLPIITSDFEIDYTTPDSNEDTMSLTVLCKNINLDDPLNDKPADNISCLPEAKEYLKDLGYVESDYVILNELKADSSDKH